MYACLAVTCHLHFWQNDRDFLRATVVTRGWNGYRNKSQHRKSTLEKKILPPFQQGFEPATFQSRVRCSNHWAIPAPRRWTAAQRFKGGKKGGGVGGPFNGVTNSGRVWRAVPESDAGSVQETVVAYRGTPTWRRFGFLLRWRGDFSWRSCRLTMTRSPLVIPPQWRVVASIILSRTSRSPWPSLDVCKDRQLDCRLLL